MRLRTLPVGAACVIVGVGLAMLDGTFRWLPAVICLIFALMCQIASNFANEYYDYKNGSDAPGRVGPRRGVTEGDITPQAMKAAAYGTLAAACVLGCSLIVWGGWWMVLAGAFIALFCIAYSAGPMPLSRVGMGQAAVMVFFGIVPVTLTYYLQTGVITYDSLLLGIAIGFLGSNILVVNNFRDREEDAAAGKKTEVVRWGRGYGLWCYAAEGILAVALSACIWWRAGAWTLIFPAIYLVMMFTLHHRLATREGRALNPVLGLTAMSELFFALTFLIVSAIKLCSGNAA